MIEIVERKAIPNLWTLAGDSDFEDRGIKIQRELYGLTPPEWLKGKRVVDVGAYIGDSTRYYLDCGASVVAYEPFPDAFQCLKHNCPEADCRMAAVGNGERYVLDPEPDKTYSHHATNWGTRGLVIADRLNDGLPETIRLDDDVVGHVDLLKIDVEGMEWAVMEGAKRLLHEQRPVVIVEVFDSMLAKFGRGRSDVLRWLPDSYHIKVGVGRWEDDRCDLICEPIPLPVEEFIEIGGLPCRIEKMPAGFWNGYVDVSGTKLDLVNYENVKSRVVTWTFAGQKDGAGWWLGFATMGRNVPKEEVRRLTEAAASELAIQLSPKEEA